MQTCTPTAMGHPGEPAKKRLHGNRFTGASSLTARQAQTIIGCMYKVRKIHKDGKGKRYKAQQTALDKAYLALYNVLEVSDRLEELD